MQRSSTNEEVPNARILQTTHVRDLCRGGRVACLRGGRSGRRIQIEVIPSDDEAEKVLSTKLIPSLVAGPTINGVKPGGKDWLLRRGSASIRGNGSIRVKVKGLVFADSGTTTTQTPNGPFTLAAVSASLFCDGATTPVGTTATAPLSADGNAKITGTLTLPAMCNAPTVMVHPGTSVAAYIAISGFRM